MKVTFLGAGKVGAPLAAHLLRAGHAVAIAESRSQAAGTMLALREGLAAPVRPVLEAVLEAEVVFLATPFASLQTVLPPLADALWGKVLVDCTNPVGPGVTHGLSSERSGSELVQSLVPGARVVKAFTIYGFENLEQPSRPGDPIRPAMFFCGDDAAAKGVVAGLIDACGFDPLDVGPLSQALHLEHMTLLWVKMVRMGGHSPQLMWAALRHAS